jgi:hypothetical protein
MNADIPIAAMKYLLPASKFFLLINNNIKEINIKKATNNPANSLFQSIILLISGRNIHVI